MYFSTFLFLPALLPLALGIALPQSAPAAAPAAPAPTACDQSCKIDNQLGKQLSPKASIVHTSVNDPRWSDLDAPNPSTVVNVATEQDVAVTVQYCVKNNIKFLAQNGGHSWVITFNIGAGDLVINLRLLSQVTFNGDKTQVTYGGGALISDVVTAAYANGVQVPTGNCNCVGTLGAILGGGFGRLMGLYGMGVDNLLSVNLVIADGQLRKVDASNADLWWALRGAGPNFGIVTSATMKSYPVPATTNGAYTGSLVFTNDKIEDLVSALNNLVLAPPMAIFLYFANQGQPAVVAIPFYAGGTVDQYKTAFASIYAVGPIVDTSSFVPYNHLNDGSDSFCTKGMRKPSYGAGLNQMDPTAWRAVFNEYVKFLQNPGTGMSAVLMEYYSMQKAQTLSDSSSSYPFRHTVKFNALVIPWYSDPALDPVAEAFGSRVRDLWRATDDVAVNSTYINFAFGDEPLETVYGANVPRLQKIKTQFDPTGQFNQFFPLSKGCTPKNNGKGKGNDGKCKNGI